MKNRKNALTILLFLGIIRFVFWDNDYSSTKLFEQEKDKSELHALEQEMDKSELNAVVTDDNPVHGKTENNEINASLPLYNSTIGLVCVHGRWFGRSFNRILELSNMMETAREIGNARIRLLSPVSNCLVSLLLNFLKFQRTF